ncbi:hypothetical protein A2U01_0064475, partial [Trifolium medium]|nr:hypothetical protein [Trifolium medium]
KAPDRVPNPEPPSPESVNEKIGSAQLPAPSPPLKPPEPPPKPPDPQSPQELVLPPPPAPPTQSLPPWHSGPIYEAMAVHTILSVARNFSATDSGDVSVVSQAELVKTSPI